MRNSILLLLITSALAGCTGSGSDTDTAAVPTPAAEPGSYQYQTTDVTTDQAIYIPKPGAWSGNWTTFRVKESYSSAALRYYVNSTAPCPGLVFEISRNETRVGGSTGDTPLVAVAAATEIGDYAYSIAGATVAPACQLRIDIKYEGMFPVEP